MDITGFKFHSDLRPGRPRENSALATVSTDLRVSVRPETACDTAGNRRGPSAGMANVLIPKRTSVLARDRTSRQAKVSGRVRDVVPLDRGPWARRIRSVLWMNRSGLMRTLTANLISQNC